MGTQILKSAHWLADRGLPCFRLKAGEKIPLADTHGCKDATCDRDQLKKWFQSGNDLNLAVATGNGVVVVDIDNKNGKNGSAAWKNLLPDCPSTLMTRTPSGGFHYWFTTDEKIRNSVGKVAEGIDLRGEDGYVVVPPSVTEGGPYQWETAPDTPIAPLPEKVLAAIRAAKGKTDRGRLPLHGGRITEGGRNDYLFRYASRLRGAGWEHADIRRDLTRENRIVCAPPLSDREVAAIAKSVLRYPSNDALTETGNAARFHTLFGHRLRYAVEEKHWLIEHEGFWRRDRAGEVTELMKAVAQEIAIGASRETGERREKLQRWAKRTEAASVIRSSLDLAKSIPGVPVRADELDTDPMLLGVHNGVVDLRTGRLSVADPALMLTKQANVTWQSDAECPRWLGFLNQIFAGDQDLIAYIKRLCGYVLTAKTREQVFILFHGSGRNGKSTFLLVLREILGDYAQHAQPELLTERRYQGGPNPSLARLPGARLVTTTETEQNQRLSESFVKQVTGSDPIEARGLYQEPFEFVPSFKIILATNHRPKIRGNDEAIWRRIHLVPFTVSIPPSDVIPDFKETLLAEASGILRWMVEGCLEWQKVGLAPPPSVVEATRQYQESEDVIGNFLQEAGFDSSRLARPEVYRIYEAWARDLGFDALPSVQLYEILRAKGFGEIKSRGHWYFTNLPVGGASWRSHELEETWDKQAQG